MFIYNYLLKILKKAKNSKVFKASAAYTFASLVTKGLAVITIPIFTRLMASDQMGIVTLYNSWYSIISTVSTLALTSGGYLIALEEYKDNRDSYISSVLGLTSINTILIGILYMFFSNKWYELSGINHHLTLMLISGLLFMPAMELWIAKQRYEFKYKIVFVITVIPAILSTVVSVGAVMFARNIHIDNLGEIRLISTNAIMYSIAFIIWISIFIKGRCPINFDYWKFSLGLSIPLIVNSIANQILNISDRIMIGKMVNNNAVGIYGVLYGEGSISLFVWSSINASFFPYMVENFVNSRNNVRNIANKIIIIYGLITIGLTACAPFLVRIMATEEYYEGISIMPPIAAGVFMISISNIYSDILIYYKKNSYIMISSIIAACVNVLMNYFGITLFGYKAAAYTTMISYFILGIIQAIVANKVHFAESSDKNHIYNDFAIFMIAISTMAICLLFTLMY